MTPNHMSTFLQHRRPRWYRSYFLLRIELIAPRRDCVAIEAFGVKSRLIYLYTTMYLLCTVGILLVAMLLLQYTGPGPTWTD